MTPPALRNTKPTSGTYIEDSDTEMDELAGSSESRKRPRGSSKRNDGKPSHQNKRPRTDSPTRELVSSDIPKKTAEGQASSSTSEIGGLRREINEVKRSNDELKQGHETMKKDLQKLMAWASKHGFPMNEDHDLLQHDQGVSRASHVAGLGSSQSSQASSQTGGKKFPKPHQVDAITRTHSNTPATSNDTTKIAIGPDEHHDELLELKLKLQSAKGEIKRLKKKNESLMEELKYNPSTAMKLPDNEIIDSYWSLNGDITQFVLQYEDLLIPVTPSAESPSELSTLLNDVTSSPEQHLRHAEFRTYILQAAVWRFIGRYIFDSKSKFWGGEPGWSELLGLREHLHGSLIDTPSNVWSKNDLRDFHDWRARTHVLMAKDYDRRHPSGDHASTRARALDMIRLLRIGAADEVESEEHGTLITAAESLIVSAVSFIQNLRNSKAHFAMGYFPEESGPGKTFDRPFKDRSMELHANSPEFSPKSDAAPKRVDLVFSPAIFKRGNADGENYNHSSCPIKAQVFCDILIGGTNPLANKPTQQEVISVEVSPVPIALFYPAIPLDEKAPASNSKPARHAKQTVLASKQASETVSPPSAISSSARRDSSIMSTDPKKTDEESSKKRVPKAKLKKATQPHDAEAQPTDESKDDVAKIPNQEGSKGSKKGVQEEPEPGRDSQKTDGGGKRRQSARTNKKDGQDHDQDGKKGTKDRKTGTGNVKKEGPSGDDSQDIVQSELQSRQKAPKPEEADEDTPMGGTSEDAERKEGDSIEVQHPDETGANQIYHRFNLPEDWDSRSPKSKKRWVRKQEKKLRKMTAKSINDSCGDDEEMEERTPAASVHKREEKKKKRKKHNAV